MTQGRILLVEDDAQLREALLDTLTLADYQCVDVSQAEDAIIELKKQSFDMVVSDIQMPGIGGIGLLNYLQQNIQIPVLLMTAYASVQHAVSAIKLGAVDYLAKPFAPEVLVNQVSRYIGVKDTGEPVIADEKTKALFSLANQVADSDASVMITGPSGSGKEVLAQFIHRHSQRKAQPFVAINCAAIPENMLEATLFGYEKGAFTGAYQACPGKFEQAHNGTLLLDEISEMALPLQAKLLRVLQEQEVERLGSRKPIKLDVRVLATSNRDLQAAVKAGDFREDLYYRINVFPLHWSALNQRKTDILPLAEHLLARHFQKSNKGYCPQLTTDAEDMLLAYHWPGNVRELDNVIQRALILAKGEQIDVNHIILESCPIPQTHPQMPINEQNTNDGLNSELRTQEHEIILATLNQCQGSRKQVAERLGISPRTLRYKLAKMREMGFDIPS